MFHSHSKDLSYFDIRLKGGQKNTILVKGNEFEVENIPIEGHVKISTHEDLHIRKVTLKLVGEFTAQYYPKNHHTSQVYERNCVLKVVWPNLLCSPQGEVVFGGYGDLMVKYHKVVAKSSKHSRENSHRNLLNFSPSPLSGNAPDPEAINREIRNLAMSESVPRLHSLLRNGTATWNFSSPTNGSANSSTTNLGEFFDVSQPKSPENGRVSRPGFMRTMSHPTVLKNQEKSLIQIPKSGIDGTPFPASLLSNSDSHSFLLPEGNYSMPFFIHLPSNIPESVEGLNCGKVRYKLECHIERGRFERSFKKSLHIIIARTLGPRNISLTDSIDFSNTWPDKMDFQVSMTRRAVALGTAAPIKLVIVPLIKGLSFHSLQAELIQHSHVTGLAGKSPEYEDIIHNQRLNCHEPFIGEDHWKIVGAYHIPNSLSKVTQTCALKDDIINVKHAIRAIIHIRNSDGHISELRAHLPVNVFLSPTHGKPTAAHLEVDNHGNFTNETCLNQQDPLFASQEREAPVDSDNESVSSLEPEFSNEELAPPMYQQYLQDLPYDQNNSRTVLDRLRQNESQVGLPYVHEKTYSKNASKLDLSVLLAIPCYEDALNNDSDDNGEDPAPDYESDLSPPTGGSVDDSGSNSARPSFSQRSVSTSDILNSRERLIAHKKKIFFHK